MRNSVKYLILDTETATLPFVNNLGLNAEEKKKLAIAKPLVYDIGWVIATRTNGVLVKKNFLVAETFSVPSVFDTAYYKEKRPLYLDMIEKGEVKVLPWNDIMDILIADMESVDYVCAYNAMFDFVKAIPFTDLYISHLYNADYYAWETRQKHNCEYILSNRQKESAGKDMMNFHLRDISVPMIDVWGVACANLINTCKYKNKCLAEGLLTNSGTFFSTSAETAKKYIDNEYGFVEDHTALSDAEIETEILFKSLKNGKRIEGITPFPFKALGDTTDYTLSAKRIEKQMAQNLLDKLVAYFGDEDESEYSNYKKGVLKKVNRVADFIAENWD